MDCSVLVGDCCNKKVQVFGSTDLSYHRYIKCRAQVWRVSVDSVGNVHVGTTKSVEVFNISGSRIAEYGGDVFEKAGDIKFPNFQSSAENMYSFVTNCVAGGCVYLFDWPNNAIVHSFRGVGDHPLGLFVDQEGSIHVCCYDHS